MNNNNADNEQAIFGCTSLKINDKQGNTYHGRTLEYSSDLKFNIAYYPKDTLLTHKAPDNKTEGLQYKTKYELLMLTSPADATTQAPVEGVNSAGLSASMNMKRDSQLPELRPDQYPKSLHWGFLTEWALSVCGSVQEVKEKVKDLTLWTNGAPSFLSSFHHIFYDTTGACVVIENNNEQLFVIDNPTGVLTNGPEFPWHLTNLNNFSHLTNVDIVTGKLGGLNLSQPDAGIATALLPSSDTSVGRFVRAVFYTSFVQIADTPQEAMIELSHIMNKFDRPKNMTKSDKNSSEYTEWTSLTDIQKKELYVRSYYSLNYAKYTLEEFSKEGEKVIIPII